VGIMELNAYIGRAGTGKSHHMIDNIKQQMKEDPLKKCFVRSKY
jgi:ATP-dependent helicase/nuclease subunit B